MNRWRDVTRTQGFYGQDTNMLKYVFPRRTRQREREREGERSTRSGLFVEIGKGVFAGLPKETTQGV